METYRPLCYVTDHSLRAPEGKAMVVNRETIPGLIEDRQEFINASGTMRSVIEPGNFLMQSILAHSYLDRAENDRLRIDYDTVGLAYLILSYETPIAWETKTGEVYKVVQELSQTTERHKGMLYLFHATR